MRESVQKEPDTHLIIGEFATLTAAHLAAAEISKLAASLKESNSDNGLRWIDISATAGGSWLCALAPSVDMAKGIVRNLDRHLKPVASHANDVERVDHVPLDRPCFKALLSLTESEPQNQTTGESGARPGREYIGIVEGPRIVDVLKSAAFYSRQGFFPLEIRVKRGGLKQGAHAFFSTLSDSAELEIPSGVLPIHRIELLGDHRRYFKS